MQQSVSGSVFRNRDGDPSMKKLPRLLLLLLLILIAIAPLFV
jgi:hypothetical protein